MAIKDIQIQDPWRQLGRRYSEASRDNTLPQVQITRPGMDTEGFYSRLQRTLDIDEEANRLSSVLARNKQEKQALEEAKFLQSQWGAVDLSGVNPQYLSQPGVTGSGTTPFGMPLQGKTRTTSGYGMRTHPVTGVHKLHDGVDFSAPTGTPIYATHSGRVISAGNSGAWGNQVMIGGSGGISTRYAHQSSVKVKPGQNVTRGQLIGYVGSTGRSTGPHLHYAVYVNGKPVNPNAYF